MSAVKKTAKFSLGIFTIFVLLLVGGAVYLYMNMDSIAKQITEKVATDTLGVPVTIKSMKISLEDKKIVVSGINISNPSGYKKRNAVEIRSITIAAQTLSKELLTFARIEVDGTNVNLEVNNKGTNLGDIKGNISQGSKPESKGKGGDIKVIVKKFSLTKAQLNPSVTLLGGDLAYITVPDIHLRNIGAKENGVLANEAMAQIMEAVFQKFNKAAGGAGFLEGLSLDTLNSIGVSTVDVFKKNLGESYKKEVDGLGNTLDGLKGMFD